MAENKTKLIIDDQNMVETRFLVTNQMIKNNSGLLSSNISSLMDIMTQISSSSTNLTEITRLAKQAKEILKTNEMTVNRIERQTQIIETNIINGERLINETSELQNNIATQINARSTGMISLTTETSDGRNLAKNAYNASSASLTIVRSHQATLASIKVLINVSGIEEQLRIDNVLLSDLRRNRSIILDRTNITEEAYRKSSQINSKLDKSIELLSRLAYLLALSDEGYYNTLETAKDSNATVEKVKGVITLLETAATGLQVNISLALENIPELATTVGLAEVGIISLQNRLTQAQNYINQCIMSIQAAIELINHENQVCLSYFLIRFFSRS